MTVSALQVSRPQRVLLPVLAIVFAVVSFGLDRVLAHDNWAGLVRIELGFHLTLIAAGVIIASYFLRTVQEK
jgi:hypothetical protein